MNYTLIPIYLIIDSNYDILTIKLSRLIPFVILFYNK